MRISDDGPRHGRRATLATGVSAVAGLLLGAMAGGPAHAGAGASGASGATGAAATARLATQADPTTPPTPAIGDAAAAAITAARWLEAFDVPAPDREAARIPLEGVSAARMALRARGRIIADVSDTVPLFGGAAVDDATVAADRDGLLRRVAGRAMAASLADRVVASLRETVGDELGSRLTMELELAGPLVPLAGRRLQDIALQVEPGLDGIALRWRDEVALAFPAAMIADATASDLGRALPGLCSELGLPVASYAELRERFGARLFRFRTIHFVQRRPGDSPSMRVRGQEIVALPAVGTATMTGAGRELFNHLVSRLWAATEPIGMRGDYDAGLNGYRPAIAPSREQALVAFAMARWAATSIVRPDDRERAAAAAAVVLDELRVVDERELPPLDDPVTAAAIVLTESVLRSIGQGAVAPALPAAATPDADADADAAEAAGLAQVVAVNRGELLARAATDVTVLVATLAATAGEQDVATLLDPHDRAVLVAAAARHALAPGAIPANRPDELRRAIDAVRGSVPPGQLVSLMPWLAMADADLATLTGRPIPGETVELMQAMRAVLEQIQIGRADAPDLAGGFALASSAVPLAGAQSVRPAVLLAWMLGRSDLTPAAEVDAHAARLLAAMRFIRQLAIRDADLWAVRSPSRAIGGIRSATWDLRMPLAAQAMGLIAYAEALDALEARASEDG